MAGPPLPPPPKLSGGMPSSGPGNAPPGASVGGPGAAGPMSAPMNTPEPMPGIEKGARVQVQIASQMLQRELPHFKLDSPEFKALSSSLSTLQKAFGKTQEGDRALIPAEIRNMIAAANPSMSPGAKAMSGGSPPPGAPPSGAPPGAPPPGMPPAM